jgi:hypothetical protein
MILMRANLLLGPLEGVAMKISTFLGPDDTCFARARAGGGGVIVYSNV